jgi:O-acetylhomoserine (thiol)-lyase
MSVADLQRAGIGPGTVRLSVGIEDAADLVVELSRAMKASQK